MVAYFSKKRKGNFPGKKFLYLGMGFLFVIIAIYLTLINLKIYRMRKEFSAQISFYQAQIEDAKKDNQRLRDGISNADNIDYLEKIAYEQLGEQKPGEKAVIFVAPEEKPKEPANPKNFWTGWLFTPDGVKSWFSGAWNWIKSLF